MATKKKTDPFDDDDDSGEGETEERGESREVETKAEPAEEPAFDLELNEEDEEPKETRKQRRQNRYREAQERAERAERDREEAIRTAQIAMHQAQQAQHSNRQTEQATDPYKSELDGLYREQDLLNREWALQPDEHRANPEVADKFIARARDIEERRYATVARREAEKSGVRPNGGNDYIQQRIRMDYPDICGNDRAMQFAEAYCRMKTATGRPMDWNLMAEGMEETRRQFGTTKAPAPTRETQQRYMGAPRGVGGAAAGNSRQTIKMTPHYMKMAEAWGSVRYPNDPPKVVYQRWANTIGRKLIGNDKDQ